MALSAARNTPKAGLDPIPARFTYPVKGTTKIYGGGIVAIIIATGYAVPASAATGRCIVGRATETVDNSTGSDGDKYVTVEAGVFAYANSAAADEIASDDIAKRCYAVDDQTVALTSNSGTRSQAGIIWKVDADGVWVFMHPLLVQVDVGDLVIDTAQIAAGALAATVAGRAIMAANFFDAATALAKFATDSIANAWLIQAIADGSFQADANTRALFADGIWTTAKLAAGILSADATGRPLVAADFFDEATVLAKFAADCIDNPELLKLVKNGAFLADADTRALFTDGIWTEAKLAAASLTGTVAAVVADDNLIGGIPVRHKFIVPAGGSGNVDFVLTHKEEITRIQLVKTNNAGGGAGTIQVNNGATAITDAMDINVADKTVIDPLTIDDSQNTIAAGGTLRFVRTRTASTDESVIAYIDAIRRT